MLEDEFTRFWVFTCQGAAEKFLRIRMTSILRSHIPSMRALAGALKRHFDNIFAFVEHHQTRAVAAELNRIIEIHKDRASGYCTLDASTDIVCLFIGDFNVPAHVASDGEPSDVMVHTGNCALSCQLPGGNPGYGRKLPRQAAGPENDLKSRLCQILDHCPLRRNRGS